jgi:hypothetical protein
MSVISFRLHARSKVDKLFGLLDMQESVYSDSFIFA